MTDDASTDDASSRQPRSLGEALGTPICERAAVVQRDPHLAAYLEPHRWPEVQAVSDELCSAAGRGKRVLAGYDRDRGVQAVVALYAAGYLPGDLRKAARALPHQPWWKSGQTKGLSSLTPEVVDRALNDAGSGRVGDMVRRAREEAGPAPLSSALPGVLAAVGGDHA